MARLDAEPVTAPHRRPARPRRLRLGQPDEARLWLAQGMNAPQEPDWSDLDPEGRAFAYQAADWARLVMTYAETGELIHPRHERARAGPERAARAADRLCRRRAVPQRRRPRAGALSLDDEGYDEEDPDHVRPRAGAGRRGSPLRPWPLGERRREPLNRRSFAAGFFAPHRIKALWAALAQLVERRIRNA